MRLCLGTLNLFGMHIIPPLTINAGTHFTYQQRDTDLSQPPGRLSQEWVDLIVSLYQGLDLSFTVLNSPSDISHISFSGWVSISINCNPFLPSQI